MSTLSSLQSLEFDRVLQLISMEAKSTLGKDAVGSRRPLSSLAACEGAQADLAEMVRFYLRDGLLPLAGLTDATLLFDRESILDLEESWQIVRSIRATQSIRETFLRSDSFPRLTLLARGIDDLGDLLTKTNKYFTREGKLREEASAELRSIRQRIHTKRNAIQKLLNDVMNRNPDAIQEPLIVMRGERYCIPVRSDNRNAVPGILHERSGSGASFFIEPIPAVELNNDLAELMIQEREEIVRIMRVLSQMLFESMDGIIVATRVAGEFDALQACAIFHDRIGATRPSFSDEHQLDLINGRHPLLDERIADLRQEAFGEEPSSRTVVPITIRLDRKTTALVVSGPNAGGKTVGLKTAGLLVALAMSGLPVPAAEGSIFPLIDAMHVLIGDDQSVLEHLSTFSAYLTRLKFVLERTTERSLVLLDELGSGTDPEEGAALAAAVIEHLLEQGSLLIVTTHLSALKSFAVNDGRIVNASMEFEAATGRPSYRIIMGLPGRSRAIEVAEIIGLPPAIIESARGRLGDRYGETDSLLAELQKRMSDVLAQQDEADRARTEAEAQQRVLGERMAQVEKERARLGATYREELERLRDDVSRQVAAEIKNLRELGRSERDRVNAATVIQAVTRSVDQAIDFIPSDTRPVGVGDRAEHRKFKIKGDVISIHGTKAELSVSGKKMTVEVRDLTLVEKGAASGSKKIPAARPMSADAAPVDAELNLIGQRVDDALDESDRFLDRALLEGKQAVRIIHGFGTGVLRKAVREHLRRHPAVTSWRAGGDNEGGDGATVAVLRG